MCLEESGLTHFLDHLENGCLGRGDKLGMGRENSCSSLAKTPLEVIYAALLFQMVDGQ
jgi:hypothetical protein